MPHQTADQTLVSGEHIWWAAQRNAVPTDTVLSMSDRFASGKCKIDRVE